MESKDAVKIAKSYVDEMFADELISEIGLEEIDFDDARSAWLITVGFRRPWSRKDERETRTPLTSGLSFIETETSSRWYKIIQIDDQTRKVIGMKDHQLQGAA